MESAIFGPIRTLELDDFDIRTIEGDGPRMLLAFTFADQDGGHSADAATLLAMAPDIETLLDVVAPLVNVQTETPDAHRTGGFQMPPVLRVGRVSSDEDESTFRADESMMVLSAPVSTGLTLSLTENNLRELPKLEPGTRPRP